MKTSLKIYLAAGITQNHNLPLIKEVVEWLKSQGHQVLDEHIASENPRGEVFMRNAKVNLEGKSLEEIENIVRDQDFIWLEEADLFIGLFFDSSFGVGVEFEHLRLLNELRRTSNIKNDRHKKIKPMLCLFLKDTPRSAMIHGVNEIERNYYTHQVFIESEKEVLPVISIFLFFHKRFAED